jgi:hypothetical protein
MQRALTFVVLATALCVTAISADQSQTGRKPADRKSWNKIRYIGGTVSIKTSPYDWNTTLTVTLQSPSITVSIAPASLFSPKQTLHIAPSRVVSLSAGPAAWRVVGEIKGALLPARTPALFGLLQDNGSLGIVYQTDDGKSGGMLLETHLIWQILPVLKSITGKTIEDSP